MLVHSSICTSAVHSSCIWQLSLKHSAFSSQSWVKDRRETNFSWIQCRDSLSAGPPQPVLTWIPPCCTTPRLNLLPRLSVTACIHFKTLLLLFMATKGAPHPPHTHTLANTLQDSVLLSASICVALTKLSPYPVKSLYFTSRSLWQLHSWCPLLCALKLYCHRFLPHWCHMI